MGVFYSDLYFDDYNTLELYLYLYLDDYHTLELYSQETRWKGGASSRAALVGSSDNCGKVLGDGYIIISTDVIN